LIKFVCYAIHTQPPRSEAGLADGEDVRFFQAVVQAALRPVNDKDVFNFVDIVNDIADNYMACVFGSLSRDAQADYYSVD
jgi:hypothetical protein